MNKTTKAIWRNHYNPFAAYSEFGVTANIEEATEALVNTLLSNNNTNRNIRKASVDKLIRDIKANNWRLTNQGIGVYEDGQLADGQHRLEAIRQTQSWGLPLLIVRGIKKDAVKAIDQGSKRTTSDSLRIYGETALDSRTVPALNVIYKDINGLSSNPTVSEISELLTEYSETLEAIYSLPIQRKDFYPAPCMAAFAVAWKDYGLASSVWLLFNEIAESNGISQNCITFYRWLTSNRKSNVGGGQAQRERFIKTLNIIFAISQGKQLTKVYSCDPR